MTTALTKTPHSFPCDPRQSLQNDLLKKSNRVDYQNFKTAARPKETFGETAEEES